MKVIFNVPFISKTYLYTTWFFWLGFKILTQKEANFPLGS